MLAAALALSLTAAPVPEPTEPEPQHIVWVHPLHRAVAAFMLERLYWDKETSYADQ